MSLIRLQLAVVSKDTVTLKGSKHGTFGGSFGPKPFLTISVEPLSGIFTTPSLKFLRTRGFRSLCVIMCVWLRSYGHKHHITVTDLRTALRSGGRAAASVTWRRRGKTARGGLTLPARLHRLHWLLPWHQPNAQWSLVIMGASLTITDYP